MDWIEQSLTGVVLVKSSKSAVENLFASLASGVVLCKLIHLVDPAGKCKFSENAEAESFFARDNISNFLSALKKLGLIESDDARFEVEDILNRKNDK